MITTQGAAAREAMSDITDNNEGMDALRDLLVLRNQADEGVADQVRVLREIGTSWFEIGSALGVTKQAAQQRYGG